jgi:DNA repair protein RecO (recombination protein O)
MVKNLQWVKFFSSDKMLQKTEGILLRKVKFSDSSDICKIFTREFGLISFIIQGTGNKKSKIKQAHLSLLNILELDIYNHPVRNLKKMKEMRCFEPLHQIQLNTVKRNQSYFILEVINRTINEDEPFPGLFDFLKNTLIQLDKSSGYDEWLTHKFMINLCQITGHEINATEHIDGSRFDLNNGRFENTTWEHPHIISKELSRELAGLVKDDRYQPPLEYRISLFYSLLDFLRIHFIGEKPIKSLSVLSMVQS